MNGELVSIVVPVFNRETQLPATLKSLEEQDYRPLQVVLVDNASTDGSLKVCEDFAREHSSDNFEILVVTENKPGAAAARNCGLDHCRADVVTFFDSDDEMSPDFVSTMYHALKSHSSNDLAICHTRLVFADGRERTRDCWPHATAAHQILAGVVTTVSFIAYKAFLYDIGGWNPSVRTWDDYELGVRLLMYARRVEWVDRTFHRIHNHTVSITGESFTATVDGILGALQCVGDDIERYSQTPDAKPHDVSLMRRALFFRYMLLKGWLAHEGNSEDAARVGAIAPANQCRVQYRMVGRLMSFLTAHGFRGTWRIGKLFLH